MMGNFLGNLALFSKHLFFKISPYNSFEWEGELRSQQVLMMNSTPLFIMGFVLSLVLTMVIVSMLAFMTEWSNLGIIIRSPLEKEHSSWYEMAVLCMILAPFGGFIHFVVTMNGQATGLAIHYYMIWVFLIFIFILGFLLLVGYTTYKGSLVVYFSGKKYIGFLIGSFFGLYLCIPVGGVFFEFYNVFMSIVTQPFCLSYVNELGQNVSVEYTRVFVTYAQMSGWSTFYICFMPWVSGPGTMEMLMSMPSMGGGFVSMNNPYFPTLLEEFENFRLSSATNLLASNKSGKPEVLEAHFEFILKHVTKYVFSSKVKTQEIINKSLWETFKGFF